MRVDGGLLIVEVPEGSEGGLLFRSGIEIELAHLRAWAARFGAEETSTISAPNVEPGEYTFCPVEVLMESPSPARSTRCPRGYLSAGGLLALRVSTDEEEGKQP